ncbi:hypothetical protein OROMI_033328 [Orobanche minor]
MAASSWMRFFFALLTVVTAAMIIGALVQLSFIRRLEDSYGAKATLTRIQSFHGDVSYWGDKEAAALRLGYVRPEVVSWSPRVIVFHNFLSPEGMKSKVRTSSGMFLSVEERKYPMIESNREANFCLLSSTGRKWGAHSGLEHRYEKNQLYRPHNDYFSDTFNLKYGGQRVATMLMYLSDGVEGGETYFPQAGDGDMGLDGHTDPSSLHGGCEVVAGEKWSATKWMRQGITS